MVKEELSHKENYIKMLDKGQTVELYEMGNKVVSTMIEALKHDDMLIRRNAATVLRWVPDERAIKPLIETLNDENEDVRRRSALAISENIYSEALPALLESVDDEDQWVRQDVIYAIGTIGGKQAEKKLLELLDDDKNRGSAVLALGKMKSKKAVEPLLDLLAQSSEETKNMSVRGIVKALGKIGEKAAIEPIRSLLQNNPDKHLMDDVIEALTALEDFETLILNSSTDNQYLRGYVFKGLKELVHINEVNTFLIQLLKDEDPIIRKLAASSLTKSSNSQNTEKLLEALKDENWEVSRWVVIALRNIGDKRAVEPIIPLLQEKNRFFREVVAYTLGELGDSKAIEPIKKAIENEEEPGVVRKLDEALQKLVQSEEEDTKVQIIQCVNCNEENKISTEIEKIKKCKKCANHLLDIPRYIVNADSKKYKKAENILRMAVSTYDLYTFEYWNAINSIHRYLFNPIRDDLEGKKYYPLHNYMTETLLQALILIFEETSDIPQLNFWINKLLFCEEDISNAIAIAAGETSKEIFVQPLISQLKSKSLKVTEGAIIGLGELRAKEAVDKLLEIIEQESRFQTVEDVVKHGFYEKHVELTKILARIKAQEKMNVHKAISALASIGDTRAIKPLKMKLKKETNQEIRNTLEKAINELNNIQKSEDN